MAGITFDGVSKIFGSVKAADDLSFHIADGEFLCLLGPSGCGKTTTLRMIAGLEQPTSGTIRIGDRDVTALPPRDRDVGMVFQDYALYPHMSVAENIAYPLKVRGVPSGERDRRTEEVARSLQIDHLIARRPGQISGGQQQRTSLARAVVHKPQVFLFDEPLSNLDAKLRLEARSFLKHLQRRLGVTSVYVTHDQAEAMALADRVAVMDRGRIVQMASPLEVYRRPATTFVANFLGSPPMNLLPVRLRISRRDTMLDGGCFGLQATPWEDRLRAEFEDGARMVLGVRPEHLRVVERDGPGVIAGDLYAVEPLGPEALVTFAAGDGLVTVRVFGDEVPEVGARAYARIDAAQCHLFRESGERVDL